MNTQEAASSGAWRWGLLFGIVNVVFMIGMSLLVGYFAQGANELVSNLVGAVIIGMSLLLCGLAGYVAARKSGNPYTGNSAGLYTGLVTSIISSSILLLWLYNASGVVRHFLLTFIVSCGCVFGVYVVLALVAGVIGGKLAQRSMAQSVQFPTGRIIAAYWMDGSAYARCWRCRQWILGCQDGSRW